MSVCVADRDSSHNGTLVGSAAAAAANHHRTASSTTTERAASMTKAASMPDVSNLGLVSCYDCMKKCAKTRLIELEIYV